MVSPLNEDLQVVHGVKKKIVSFKSKLLRRVLNSKGQIWICVHMNKANRGLSRGYIHICVYIHVCVCVCVYMCMCVFVAIITEEKNMNLAIGIQQKVEG